VFAERSVRGSWMPATLWMSLPERERVFAARRAGSGQLIERVAAEQLGIGLRQMRRSDQYLPLVR
jgi:hypothetical protein